VSSRHADELEGADEGALARLHHRSVLLGLVLVAALAPLGRSHSLGAALGAAVGLGLFGLDIAVVRGWLARPGRPHIPLGHGLLWLLRWPAAALVLWWPLRGGVVSPAGVCLGAGLVPAAATWAALACLLAAHRAKTMAGER